MRREYTARRVQGKKCRAALPNSLALKSPSVGANAVMALLTVYIVGEVFFRDAVVLARLTQRDDRRVYLVAQGRVILADTDRHIVANDALIGDGFARKSKVLPLVSLQQAESPCTEAWKDPSRRSDIKSMNT